MIIPDHILRKRMLRYLNNATHACNAYMRAHEGAVFQDGVKVLIVCAMIKAQATVEGATRITDRVVEPHLGVPKS